VEDNAATSRLLSRMLLKRGYQVTTVSTVESAIETARNERFDMLISDLGLPDGTGLDVMREIRNFYGIPGIAISGYGTEEDIRQSRCAGFSEHLVKPVDFNSISAAVQHVLHG
jgi:CheY-like chemotaxis protein